MSVDNQGPIDDNGEPIFGNEQTKPKYVWYIGEPIASTSLWVRKNGNEYPIYANTRGQREWYSFDVDDYENTQLTELSDEFIEWLAHYHRARNGLVDSDGMTSPIKIEQDAPDVEPEWYETELLNAIGNPCAMPEQEDLLEWAYNQVE